MKVLHFALLAPGSPQWGLRNALRSIASEYAEFDWYGLWASGDLDELRFRFIEQARTFRPDLTFIQAQTANLLPGGLLDQIPGFRFNWCGDLRDELPRWAVEMAPHVDVMAFSNGRDVASVRARGFASEFLNIGVTLETFTPDAPTEASTPIQFFGNNYENRFPCSHLRQRAVAMLRERYGNRFAVHGNGWGPAEQWVDEEREAALYRGCKIALDINHYMTVDRFTSDRRFRAMASGAFCLCNDHPGLEEDFTPGIHLVKWKAIEELPVLIDYYLEHDAERQAIARAGCEHVRTNHSWAARMLDIQRIMGQHRKAAA